MKHPRLRRRKDRVAGTVHHGEGVIMYRGRLWQVTPDGMTPLDLDDLHEEEHGAVICGTGMDPNILDMPGPGVPPRPQAPKPTLAAAILRLLNR